MTDPVIWITGYEEVQDALKCAGLRMASYDGAKSTVFADVLITLEGAPHLSRRRVETALVRPEIVAMLEHRLVPTAARRLLEPAVRAGQADLVELSSLIATSTAARVVGLDIGEDFKRLEDLARLMARLHEGVVIEWTTKARESVLSDVREALEEYRQRFFEPALRRRAAITREGGVDRAALDLVQLLLMHRDVEPLDDSQILRETIHFLAATAHTTATVVTQACHETWRWVEEHPGDAELLADSEFVRACVGEALRLWPPSGWAFRIATEDVRLASGREVRLGRKLGLNLVEANRDPSVFGQNADRFDPRRARIGSIPEYGLAFGTGTHVCLGRRLAAGTTGTRDAPGTLTATLMELFAAGCRPHPTKPPVIKTGTERHQFQAYPVCFTASLRRALNEHPVATVR